MSMTTATIEIINNKEAILEINYADGKFGIQRIEKSRNGDISELYERGYNLADIAATEQGFRLERYSRI